MFVCLFVSILWLQEPYAVILDPKKIKSIIVSIISPPICHEVNRLEAISSVHFSSVLFDSLPPHGLQHSRLTYLSITNSQSLFKLMPIESVMPFNHLVLCHPLLSCLQSFPTSGSFPMSQFFTSGGQSIGVLTSASVLPMNIQD